MSNEEILQKAKDQVAKEAEYKEGVKYEKWEELMAAIAIDYYQDPLALSFQQLMYSHKASLLAIQSAREEAAPKWIPVSESLPVIEEGYNSYTVLIYTNETYTWTGYYNHWKECWFSDIDEKVIVTHWMPLPDHPVVEFPFLKN